MGPIHDLPRYLEEVIKPTLYRKMRRNGIPHHAAEDLVQNALLKVFRGGPWIWEGTVNDLYRQCFQAANGIMVDYYRAQWRRRISAAIEPDSDDGTGFDPEDRRDEERARNRELLEIYQRAKSIVFDPGSHYYAKRDPIVREFDLELVGRWELAPDKSLSKLGRELDSQFAAQDPEGVVTGKARTFACTRLALFIDRIRQVLGE